MKYNHISFEEYEKHNTPPMVGNTISYKKDGKFHFYNYRIAGSKLTDHPEYLAQGRFLANEMRHRYYNRLPIHKSVDDAWKHLHQNS